LNPWEKGLWFLTTGLTAAVLVKLWLTGLIKIYKLLFTYLFVDFASSIGAMTIPFRSKMYGDFYFTAQTLKIVVAAFVLIEIYSLALERHPALARFGRSVVGYILLAAGVFPFIELWLNHANAKAYPYLRAFLLFERTLDSTIAIFLVLISAFMTWFPVRLRKNVILYISGFIVWSLSRSILVHVVNQWFREPRIRVGANIVQLCFELGCLVFWLIGFQREGEVRTAVVGHVWNRAEADKLVEQLDAINDSFEKMRRR
jgi:hypothetical protein